MKHTTCMHTYMHNTNNSAAYDSKNTYVYTYIQTYIRIHTYINTSVSLRTAISVMKHTQIVLLLMMPSVLHILLGGVMCGASSDAFVWSVLAPVASLYFMANEDRRVHQNTAWPADRVRAIIHTYMYACIYVIYQCSCGLTRSSCVCMCI